MSSDPNELQNSEAAKLTAHQHETALHSATVAVTTALRHLKDVDRKRVLDDAPWLFISHMKQQVAIRKRVSGFVMQPTYIYYFNNVGLG